MRESSEEFPIKSLVIKNERVVKEEVNEDDYDPKTKVTSWIRRVGK